MTEPVTALSDEMVLQLQSQPFVLLHNVDADSGYPTSSVISWVFAPDAKRIRFAVDGRSRLVRNMASRPDICLTVFSPCTAQAVYGKVRVLSDDLDGVPFRLVCYEAEIDTVRNAMFHGSRLAAVPEFEKTYDKRAADKLDGQVFEAIRKA
ncbi:pyridoxamine 5'-phosphate oxidase [Paenibacillus sp. 32O-W]|uniref:pyridoxamine 5'-phosphate oxidase family protein n=1 Tax=Paenibacillus sp. 32O-W TaxID=1695218 RepID=UPI0007208B98|nr:pyridoxamine 5'-phosphate oxidase family protein [Paenibacillus sp. 32O-W]ALS27331.1 pyridoxamine 5'-phosphate oxidase [Paenibacillus sp. 32O-W]